jgi:hypothetical protein
LGLWVLRFTRKCRMFKSRNGGTRDSVDSVDSVDSLDSDSSRVVPVTVKWGD